MPEICTPILYLVHSCSYRMCIVCLFVNNGLHVFFITLPELQLGITITSNNSTKKALWGGGGGGGGRWGETLNIYDPQSKSNPQSSWQQTQAHRKLFDLKEGQDKSRKQISIITHWACFLKYKCTVQWLKPHEQCQCKSKVILSLITLLCFFSNVAEPTAAETLANLYYGYHGCWLMTNPRLQILNWR